MRGGYRHFLFSMMIAIWCSCVTTRVFAKSNPPILILQSPGDYSEYVGEMLKVEGLNCFTIAPVSNSTTEPGWLTRFDLVILPKSKLKAEELKRLSDFVNGGGHLIAFEPDERLFPIFGIRKLNDAAPAGYIRLLAQTEWMVGLLNNPLRIHAGSSSGKPIEAIVLASFTGETASVNEQAAIVLNKYGEGEAIAFLYDLPRSIAATRQGNEALAAQETDGITGIRAMDLFTGGWVNGAQNTLNPADEQLRILTRCIDRLGRFKKPLPRIWYFPAQRNAAIVLTNDGENTEEHDFVQQFREVSEAGAAMTLYILEPEKISRRFVDSLHNAGHEMAAHPDATKDATAPDWKIVDHAIGLKLQQLRDDYGIRNVRTNTNHWFVWCGLDSSGAHDFTAGAKLEEKHGIRMDVNYAHYDNNSTQPHFLGASGWPQGNFTGSGLSMKFVDSGGKLVHVYQLFNNVYDQQYMEKKDPDGYFDAFRGLIDRSLDSGIFSVTCIRAHNNEYFFSRTPLLHMLNYARQKGIPVWTASEWLSYMTAKDDVQFTDLRESNHLLRFAIQSATACSEPLTCLLPAEARGMKLKSIFMDSRKLPLVSKKIKGRAWMVFNFKSGTNHQVEAHYE